jgi:hypothetical protein
MPEIASRVGDMDPDLNLKLCAENDGDMIVAIEHNGRIVGGHIISDPDIPSAEVQFCVSGGRSPHTRKALFNLMKAMEQDNQMCPVDD